MNTPVRVSFGNKGTVLEKKKCFLSDRKFLLSIALLVSVLHSAKEKRERQEKGKGMCIK